MALDLSPLIAAKDIDFSIKTEAVPIESHDWMLTELTRNLLHNGSCLGLAICSEITSALGGTISLENRVVQGRVAGLNATVRLPVAAAPLQLVQNGD